MDGDILGEENQQSEGVRDSPVASEILVTETREDSSPSAAGKAVNHGKTGGPGRKSRACLECKKLKMKCEVFPGDRKCQHCLRRNVSCIIKRSYNARIDDTRDTSGSVEAYEQKIDAMHAEIMRMRQSLDAVLASKDVIQRRADEHVQSRVVVPPQRPHVHFPEEHQAAHTLLSVNQHSAPLSGTPGSTTSAAGLSSREDNMQMAMTRENSLEPTSSGDQSNGPVTVEDPMGSLYEVTRLRNIRSNRSKTTRPQPGSQGELNDFISRGVISEAEAEELYKIFHTSLNHYLWVGLEQTHPSFNSVRKSSELLTATILTVTALHIPTSASTFDACYKEFLSLISSSMFSRYHSIDDVRGLCIAAFWLSEVSWKLSGHAIRIATELNIHQSFSRALEGDREHFLRARLWYMLYVCDHHFSIAYGRPPMIAESIQIREHELFLASPFADALDARILSQVSLMQILTRVYDRFAERRLPPLGQVRAGGSQTMAYTSPEANFLRSNSSNNDLMSYQAALISDSMSGFSNSSGTGVEDGSHGDPSAVMLAESDFEALRSFNLEIDQWRMRWHARQNRNSFIGTFPPKGIILYSYFAKLQLNSLAVRGVSLSTSSSGRLLSTERKEFANMAVSAAASTITFVLEEEDMRRALVGTPLYVHTMIAFASVFLMKVATKWNQVMGLNVDEGYISRLLGKMIWVMKSAVTSDRHVLKHIAAGLEKMLEKLEESKSQRGSAEREGSGQEGLVQGGLVEGIGSHSYGHPNANYGVESGLPPALGDAPPSMNIQLPPPPATWGATAYGSGQPPQAAEQDCLGDDFTVMNDSLMYEAFGTGSATDVYNLLSSQFSF